MSAATTATKGKVYVGLSGGVDSAVSAALLQWQGYEVVGAFIRIVLPGYPCSAQDDKLAAQRVAARLGIPFVEVDLSAEYKKRVFELTMREFARGQTPNPDALCNREIKFGIFYDWCMAQGADFVATGHYARLHDGALLAGIDNNKDQSYFLWAVPQDKLVKTLFPVGGLRKWQVRLLARLLRLPNYARPDSQGLCFLGDISMSDMLHNELSLVPGDVLDEQGALIGRHEGAPAYTLGQRHGFELFGTGPHTKPHYVVAKDAEFNTITVSPHKFPKGARATEVVLRDTNWIGDVTSGRVSARYRYRGALIPATLDVEKGVVTLHEAHYVPLGQSLVLYTHNPLRSEARRCLGGGIIESATLKAWLSLSTNQTARPSRSTNASS